MGLIKTCFKKDEIKSMTLVSSNFYTKDAGLKFLQIELEKILDQ